MYLEKLYALNFKNYHEIDVTLDPRMNVFVGKNGSGKTNLLDAIYYLSFTKSALSSADTHSVRHGENFFMVKGSFATAGAHEVTISFQSGVKKTCLEDGNEYDRFNHHIGKYPVVLITPDDTAIIKEGSEVRRKFFDGMLAQLDPKYLEDLLSYQHALKQRNALLKLFFDTGKQDAVVLQVYDERLISTGTYIHQRRKELMQEFGVVFKSFFKGIVQEDEHTEIVYQSQLTHETFEHGLTAGRGRDLMLQRTSFGIHKDDFEFKIGGGDIKRLGSQGQQKSFVISLKLAQHKTIEMYKGFKPMLLLDDIFDKLDDDRIGRLVTILQGDIGQVFITDARPHRTKELMDTIGIQGKVFLVEKGMVNIVRDFT
jgi:DNA replication and repair protein RecF